METLISDMENINIRQHTTLQLMQENLDMAQSLQAESEYRWDQWFGINHPSEQEGKLGGDSLPH